MKKFIAMFMCAALMACVSVSAQDIYKTAANVPMVQLNNGVLMPQFGLGTFMLILHRISEYPRKQVNTV